MEIIKIIIKSASGYVPIDKAYEDKIILMETFISYEYKPYLKSGPKNNDYKKWSYKTTSKVFKQIFKNIAAMTPEVIYNDQILFATDIVPIEITVTFDDKHREKANFFCPSDFFQDYFREIKKLVPPCEEIPVVLLTSDDFDDEE